MNIFIPLLYKSSSCSLISLTAFIHVEVQHLIGTLITNKRLKTRQLHPFQWSHVERIFRWKKPRTNGWSSLARWMLQCRVDAMFLGSKMFRSQINLGLFL